MRRYRPVKVVLLDAIPPLMLKTPDNPDGSPIETFDEIRAGVARDRSQFCKDLSGPFYGANRPGADVSQGVRGCVPAVERAVPPPCSRRYGVARSDTRGCPENARRPSGQVRSADMQDGHTLKAPSTAIRMATRTAAAPEFPAPATSRFVMLPVGRPAFSGQRIWSYFMLHAAGSGTRRGLPAESYSRVPNEDESDYTGARCTAQYPRALSRSSDTRYGGPARLSPKH